jgi:hypothetical protein
MKTLRPAARNGEALHQPDHLAEGRGVGVALLRETFSPISDWHPAAAKSAASKGLSARCARRRGIPSRLNPASSFYAAAGKKFAIDPVAPLPARSAFNAGLKGFGAPALSLFSQSAALVLSPASGDPQAAAIVSPPQPSDRSAISCAVAARPGGSGRAPPACR